MKDLRRLNDEERNIQGSNRRRDGDDERERKENVTLDCCYGVVSE